MGRSMRKNSERFSVDDALEAETGFVPASDGEDIRVEPIAEGASGRAFFRIRRKDRSHVLMHFPEEPAENHYYAGIGRVLAAHGIPVGRILREASELRLVWIEDLGSREFFDLREKPELRRAAYTKALEALVRLQELPEDLFAEASVRHLPAFDEALYRFEHRYFLSEFAARTAPSLDLLASGVGRDLETLLGQILSEDSLRVWVHRDFQSKNLLLDRFDRVRIVDFQGLRRGHPFYDLASLLDDPYAELPRAFRADLASCFIESMPLSPPDPPASFARLRCQRLLQALGAYGRHGLGTGVRFFQECIPVALQHLEEAAGEADLPELEAFSRRLREA